MRREPRGSTREERAAETTALRRHQEEQRTRELHVVKKDVSRLGGTACCRACEKLVIGLPAGTIHSSECGQQMTDRMMQKDLDQKCWSKHNLKQQRQNSRRERGENREGQQEKRE